MTSVDRNRVTKASPIRFSNHRRRVLSTYSSDEIQLGEIYSLENINCFGDKRERTNKVDVKRRTDFLTSEMFALEFGIFKRINCSLGHKLNIDCLKVRENFCVCFRIYGVGCRYRLFVQLNQFCRRMFFLFSTKCYVLGVANESHVDEMTLNELTKQHYYYI
jgi:hypothetical protein